MSRAARMASPGSSDPSGAVWEAVLAVANTIPIGEFRNGETLERLRTAIREAEPAAHDLEVAFGVAMPVYIHYHLPGDPFQKLLWLFENDFAGGVFGARF